jgi:polar amino acid transport system substrate-binding protein
MKTDKIKLIPLFTAAVLALSLLLTGCGASNSVSAASANTESSPSASTTAKIKIVVATGGQPKPYAYVDENNQLVGYDIDLVRAIFKELPQYDVSFEKTEFTSIFAGLDSDRYQIGANHFAKNKQREEKYLFSNPDFQNKYVIAVPVDSTNINSISDLQGKTTEVQSSVNFTTALEEYNKTHTDKPVILNYSQADMVTVLQHVESGKYDFQLIDGPTLDTYVKQYGLKLKAIQLSEADSNLIGDPYTYLLISKGATGAQLQKDINEVLAKLIKDGTVSQISSKYFGVDYAPKP